MSALKKISSYKGVAQRIQAGDLDFMIVTGDVRDLETIYYSILTDAEAFEPEKTSRVIVISQDDLRKFTEGNFTDSQPDTTTTDEKAERK